MTRILLTCVLAGATALGQSAPAAQSSKPPANAPQPQTPAAEKLPLDTVVITIHGVCPDNKSGEPFNADSCVTKITKEQFTRIVAGVNLGSLNPVAVRNFAQNYVQILTLAAAGEKAGLDKDPNFQELLKVMRSRALAEAYRRAMAQMYGNPTPDELEAYYRKNLDKYERLQVDRLFVPKSNANLPKEQQADFAAKAQQLASEMRERAVKGEDVSQLQTEAYDKLALLAPPKTDLGFKPKNFFAPSMGQKLWALKVGEVSGLELEPAGWIFYKVRARNAIPLETLKEGLTRELSEKNAEAAIQQVVGGVHSELNEQFFNGLATGPPQKPPTARPPSTPPR